MGLGLAKFVLPRLASDFSGMGLLGSDFSSRVHFVFVFFVLPRECPKRSPWQFGVDVGARGRGMAGNLLGAICSSAVQTAATTVVVSSPILILSCPIASCLRLSCFSSSSRGLVVVTVMVILDVADCGGGGVALGRFNSYGLGRRA